MGKKIGIILSVVLAIAFTFGIWQAANKKYNEVAKTTEVLQTTAYIPAGQVFTEDNINTVEIPEIMAEGLVNDMEEVIDKPVQVSLIKGQYIYPGAIGEGVGRTEGFREVYIPVDLSSSALAIAGERVNINLISNNREAPTSQVVLENARVTHCLDSNGQEITPDRKKQLGDITGLNTPIPVSIAVEVPPDKEPIIVQAASQDRLYLSKI
ncbi:MAG: hypothetical protein FH756_00320 [Firmicutes bacterium]|nr:hypothetical protein [Bacillota bacterium]